METKDVWGLSCAGGGAHGSYQVGVLKYIHQHFSKDNKSPFQVFTGASCGALNTTFYAAESFNSAQAALRLEELWLGFHVPEYHGNFFKNAIMAWLRNRRRSPEDRNPIWSVLDPSPMRQTLQKGLQRDHLEKALREKTTRGVAIATTELLSGRVCWFIEGELARTWNLFHSISIKDKIDFLHLAASCSVPIFLPPVKIGDHYYVDGTVSLSKPLIAAISMGATKILSIATDQPYPLELPTYRKGFSPRLSHVVGMLLNRLSHDAAADQTAEINAYNQFREALEKERRIKTAKGAKPSEIPLYDERSKPDDYQKVEIFRIIPSKRIRIFADYVKTPDTMKRRKTRFMFHESFIRELIDLGYQDAKARHDELAGFFWSQAPKKRWGLFR